MSQFKTTDAQIKDIIAHPFDRKWTIQGFGMLRTYLDDEEIERLHIWDVDTANPDVSTIHDHPWDFDSRIVVGRLTNCRFEFNAPVGLIHKFAKIKTGEGGGLVDDKVGTTVLALAPEEHYGIDETYHQDAPELHESLPEAGTVTVIRRIFHAPRDDQYATVCWRRGDWVTAEPRLATEDEIQHFISIARKRWLYG
jgi:hypothetical protein